MRFEAIPFDQVDEGLFSVWSGLQAGSPDLSSPFFSPSFARVVAACRDDLFLGVIEDASGVSGVLPFHRKGRCGVPIAGQFGDYEGVIGTPPEPELIREMLSGFGLGSYDFNHALEAQKLFKNNAFWRSRSPIADLRQGHDAWMKDVMANTKALKSLARKRRKTARELGPLRFVEQDESAESWRTFVAWKDTALRDLGRSGFPGPNWVAQMIDRLRATCTPSFDGCFSTLYAGDRLLAGHFGIRSARVWHWWFPTYDRDLSRYSPGLLLLQDCIEAAAHGGYDELDFGLGSERYKSEFANGSRALCEGSLERSGAAGMTRAGRKAVQGLANRVLSEKSADVVRRAGTKLLRAGLL